MSSITLDCPYEFGNIFWPVRPQGKYVHIFNSTNCQSHPLVLNGYKKRKGHPLESYNNTGKYH